MCEVRNAYKILIEEREGKRPLGGRSLRWENSIMDIREIGWEGVNCIRLVHNKDQWRTVVNTVMNFRTP
jgi:hypothetical protein